jgi:hypothetical protein
MHKGELKDLSHPPLRLHHLLAVCLAAETLLSPLLSVENPTAHAAVAWLVTAVWVAIAKKVKLDGN